MKMTCATCDKTIHSDIEYVDVIMVHYFDTKRVNEKRTYMCPECAPGLYRQLGLTAEAKSE
jgi:uncharacterized protein YlaI